MCKALEIAQMMNNSIIEAKNYHYTLQMKLKTLDLSQQDLLHKIEHMDKFNLMKAWEITKALNELRHERRKIKNELFTMNILVNNLVNKQCVDVTLNNTVVELIGKNSELTRLDKNKIYNNRVLKNIDTPLNATNDMLKSLDNIKSDVYKNTMGSTSNLNVPNDKIASKIYNFGEKKLKKDSGKGSSIKIRYISQKQYNSILNILVPQYTTFSINTTQKYFHLICKKF
jgi:hypothetical protein